MWHRCDDAWHVWMPEDKRNAEVADMSVLVCSGHVFVVFAKGLAVVADEYDERRVGDACVV